MAALYSAEILRLATNIPYHAPLADADASVSLRSPVCGSEVSIAVRLDESGHVAALGQDVKACALGQASAAIMGSQIIGRTGDEIVEAGAALADFLAGDRDDPGSWPGIETLACARDYPARHRSICLPFEAAVKAVAEARGSLGNKI